MVFVELGELAEGVVADYVRVEDEEWGGVFGEGFFGEFEGPGGAEGLGFDGEGYVYVEFFFVLWTWTLSVDIRIPFSERGGGIEQKY